MLASGAMKRKDRAMWPHCGLPECPIEGLATKAAIGPCELLLVDRKIEKLINTRQVPLVAQVRSADRAWKCLMFGVDRT